MASQIVQCRPYSDFFFINSPENIPQYFYEYIHCVVKLVSISSMYTCTSCKAVIHISYYVCQVLMSDRL